MTIKKTMDNAVNSGIMTDANWLWLVCGCGLVVRFVATRAFLAAGFLGFVGMRRAYFVTEMVLPCSAEGAVTIRRPLVSLEILYPVPFAAQVVAH